MRVEVDASSATAEISSPTLPLDLTVYPGTTAPALGPAHWIEFLTAGDWTFTDARGHSVTYTGLAAGAAYAIQATAITVAPASAKLRVGWP